jgi:DNA-binding transcriptional regulator YiaG
MISNTELKNIRVELNKTQKEFAEQLGIATVTLRHYEYGRLQIPKSIDLLLKLQIQSLQSRRLFKRNKSKRHTLRK